LSLSYIKRVISIVQQHSLEIKPIYHSIKLKCPVIPDDDYHMRNARGTCAYPKLPPSSLPRSLIVFPRICFTLCIPCTIYNWISRQQTTPLEPDKTVQYMKDRPLFVRNQWNNRRQERTLWNLAGLEIPNRAPKPLIDPADWRIFPQLSLCIEGPSLRIQNAPAAQT
jgi:hypothetical protein